MLRARWWVPAVLGLLTVTVVVLDVTGVIFESEPTLTPPVPLQFDEPAVVDAALAPVDVFAARGLSPGAEQALGKILGRPSPWTASLGDGRLRFRTGLCIDRARVSRRPQHRRSSC